MRSAITILAISLAGLCGAGGCVDRTPPPPDARIPHESGGVRTRDAVRPMPDADEPHRRSSLPPPPFNDVPLVVQETPEQRAFVEAYESVGRPRIVVFVNRTLEGELLPVNVDDPLISVQRTRTGRGDVSVETRQRSGTDARYRDGFRDDDVHSDRETTDRFESRGDRPAEYRDRTDLYLRPGQYDEAAAREIDYEAIEAILTDWLSAGGRVEIVSPIMARQRLTDEQVEDLQSGRPRVMGEIARELDADVLIHVTVRPTRQTHRGLELRLVAEAMNVGDGGQSIGRAVTDIPPPLDKPRINKFTRFLARVLMDRMITTWERLPAPAAGGTPRRQDERDDDSGPLQTRPAVPPADEPAPERQ